MKIFDADAPEARIHRGRPRKDGTPVQPSRKPVVGGPVAARVPESSTELQARPPAVLSDEDATVNAHAIERFVQVLGGRDEVMATLSLADSTAETDRVVGYLLDPRYQKLSLPKLCAMTGITVADLLASFRKASMLKAHIRASQIIAERLPPIVEDVMARATPVELPCPSCGGTPVPTLTVVGEPPPRPCPTCRGVGRVYSEPDLDRQKLALELGQLGDKKGGGFIVQQSVNTTVTQTTFNPRLGVLDKLQGMVGDFLNASSASPSAPDRRKPVPVPINPNEADVPLPFAEPPETREGEEPESEDVPDEDGPGDLPLSS